MPARPRVLATVLILCGLSPGAAEAQEPAPASEAPTASAPRSRPLASSPGPGAPDRPAAADVAPTRGQVSQDDGEGPKTLAKLLGLEDSPVTVFGWIQNSYTGTPGFDPRNGSTVTVFPNRLANAWQGNQYYFVVEAPTGTGEGPELGFRVDTLFGNDWMFTKSFGLFDGAFTPNSFAGVDFPQIYGELRLPLGGSRALRLKGGRFYSPAGFESAMAVKRPLLSVPYVLEYTPFTFFGALSSLELNDRLTIVNALVNGADRWINSNYHYSYLGGLSWHSADHRTTFSSMTLVGPNQLPFFPSTNPQQAPTLPMGSYTSPKLAGRRNPYYGRSTAVFHSTTGTRKWGAEGRWTQVLEAAFVTEGNALGYGPGGSPGRIAYYGGAHWLLFEATPKLTAVSRIEAFRDNNGFVLPAADNYYEITHGLILKPRPDLWIRPEIRYDWAQTTKPYDDGTRSGQITLAVDVVIQF